MWWASVRRDSQPGYWQREPSRSRMARRSAAGGLRLRRPTFKTLPSAPWIMVLIVALQPMSRKVAGLIAGPSSRWQRPG
jgi:hypothetical protein